MKYPIFKNKAKILLSMLTLLTLFAAPVNHTHAAYLEEICADYPSDPPDPQQIVCPIARALNVVLLSVGAIFVIIVLVTSIKFAMSQGDFKGVLGAKNSLTWAVVGFLVVAGIFGLVTLLANIFGIPLGNVSSSGPFLLFNQGLERLMIWAGLL